jgi:urea transport system substrate-binding protein
MVARKSPVDRQHCLLFRHCIVSIRLAGGTGALGDWPRFCCLTEAETRKRGRHQVLSRIWHAAAAAAVIASVPMAATAQSGGTIKIGVLHSLSGTMAISETTLKDTILMMVDDVNKKGGLLGKKVEAVVVDPASNWPLFAEKARDLLSKDKVAAVFGCWTSVSRKSVLPVFEELNGLLFYPVQYEGEESSNNVFYTGAAPNQQAIPAVEYLMSPEGGSVKRWVLEGTDYVYPRTTNKILEAFLKSKGVAPEDIKIDYTPFGHSDWQTEVAAIKSFASAGKKTAVVSTINGDANVPFYKELANTGIKASDIPVVAFSVGEEELAGIDTKNLVGHLAAWNYFQSVKNPTNEVFIKQWHDYIKNPKRVTNDPMEAHYIGFTMWKQAVEQAGTTDVDAVRQAMYGQKIKAPSGFVEVMNTNHHLSKPVMIGEIQGNGQFDVVWQTKDAIKADAWSPYLAEDKGKVADWTYPWVCGNCTAPKYTD